MIWLIEYSDQFRRAARKLDKTELQRIVNYLDQLATLSSPRDRGKALSGQLSGYWRYRIGDYRVLVEIRDKQLTIVAITVGHRRDVYR